MVLTRSIRFKLIIGLALVLVMMATLSISGLVGLWSYRQAVRELTFSVFEAPDRERLEAELGALATPLLDSVSTVSRQDLRDCHRGASEAFSEYQLRWGRLEVSPSDRSSRAVSRQLLAQLDRQLQSIDESLVGVGRLSVASRVELGSRVAASLRTARSLPDPRAGLRSRLRDTEGALASRTRWLIGSTIAAVLMFVAFVHAGYRWVFQPIRVLHEGARRVAQGDLDYRVELSTRDEMAELAESFNQMTDRFREIRDDLDSQVRDRSRQLVRSERLAGVGFLAAGVAHEINNPLAAIAMAGESLQDRLEALLGQAAPDEQTVIRQYAEMIGREAFRCQEITARLLDFSRGQDASRAPHDLIQLVNEVLALVGHMSRFRDRRITFSASGTCRLEINGPQIKQVVLNLVANALESTGEGGSLDIELASQTDLVTLSFSDDGCGMTSETIDNLFEPFFTTKSTGKGTGLGLSISHRIISEHGGTIEASSGGVGQGSLFRLQLPRRSEQTDSDWVVESLSSERLDSAGLVEDGAEGGKTIEADGEF
jgi:two-component system NtrC family sensor kinase